ncbi:D-alanyl-D-alanine carboxypeptidase family protein [Bacillota bacterium Meth-B3]
MRFVVCVLLFLSLCAPALAQDAQAVPFAPDQVEARAMILIERASGRVLCEHNADELLPIASITKVMTALLAIEHCDQTDIVTVGRNASGVSGTSLYLGLGERLTLKQLLLGLMLRSGNDAAVALAEHVAGDEEAFVRLMNERAAMLGVQAHFANPHGLDDENHVATARAMALIANEAMDYPAFRALARTREARIPWSGNPYERALTNKNKLLWTYEGATGVKTGFTGKAGRCLIFSAERDGMELLGVVLNCGQWFEAAAQLMDWGFAHYRFETFLTMGQVIKRLPVEGGMKWSVPVIAPATLTAPVGVAEAARLVIETEVRLTAPVRDGQVVGRADVIVAGEVIRSLPLLAGESVDEHTYAAGLRRALRHFNPVG